MEFLDAISHTIGNIKSQEIDFTSDSEYSDEEFTESTVESNGGAAHVRICHISESNFVSSAHVRIDFCKFCTCPN